jgi:putative FmdB family regulatory protein
MPTYEYQCKSCGQVFDQFQSIKAKPLRSCRCDRCGRVRPVQRLIGTGAALLFRGSGFYQTDYRSESYKKAASAESKPASGGDAKSAGAEKSTASGSKKSATPASDAPSGKKA